MRRRLVFTTGVFLAGLLAAGAFSLLGGTESRSRVSAEKPNAPSLRETPDVNPPVFAPSGVVSVDEARLPLGMGCSELDKDKVMGVLRADLKARGITEINGPGLVKYCRQEGEHWVLGVMVPVGASKAGRTLAAPAACKTTTAGAPTQSCLPSQQEAATLDDDGRIHFELSVENSEVRR